MRVGREGHEVRGHAEGKCRKKYSKKYSSYCVTGFDPELHDDGANEVDGHEDGGWEEKTSDLCRVGYVFKNLDSTIDTIEVATAYPCASLQKKIRLQQPQSCLQSLQQSFGQHQSAGAAVRRP